MKVFSAGSLGGIYIFVIIVFLTTTATTTVAEDAQQRAVSPRVLMREAFPSGLKIDRFSATWPSSASVMADMLEAATAREMLQKQAKGQNDGNGSNRRRLSPRERETLQESASMVTRPPPTGKSSQRAPPFRRADNNGNKGAAAAGGLLYVAAEYAMCL